MGRLWRQRFPQASSEDIRIFLAVVTGAFSLRPKDGLLLGPDEALFAIYRMFYPHPAMPDAMELELLDIEFRKRYGLSLPDIWREDLTLGELFSSTHGCRSAVISERKAR